MDTTIKLIYVNHMETDFLKVPEQTPALLLESIHYTKENQPLARNKFYVLPEYYQLHFPLLSQIHQIGEPDRDGWEKFVRRIADMKYRINITGSNSKMLSSEIASTLRRALCDYEYLSIFFL